MFIEAIYAERPHGTVEFCWTARRFYDSLRRMEKDFDGWHRLKTEINTRSNAPTFQRREVWWCGVGVNIGHETDGKHKDYSRPVLVIRKFNSYIFLGAPLTTQMKENPYYHHIHFKGKAQCVMLSQLRLWDGKRLTDKMGQLPEAQFQAVLKAIRGLFR